MPDVEQSDEDDVEASERDESGLDSPVPIVIDTNLPDVDLGELFPPEKWSRIRVPSSRGFPEVDLSGAGPSGESGHPDPRHPSEYTPGVVRILYGPPEAVEGDVWEKRPVVWEKRPIVESEISVAEDERPVVPEDEMLVVEVPPPPQREEVRLTSFQDFLAKYRAATRIPHRMHPLQPPVPTLDPMPSGADVSSQPPQSGGNVGAGQESPISSAGHQSRLSGQVRRRSDEEEEVPDEPPSQRQRIVEDVMDYSYWFVKWALGLDQDSQEGSDTTSSESKRRRREDEDDEGGERPRSRQRT